MSCHVIFSNLDVDYHIINHIIIYF